MKKLFISLLIIVLVFLTIPLIGNKVIESEINNQVEVLTSYGIKIKDSKTDASYLSTKKYFLFKVEDKDKFITYLNQFSGRQLPLYRDALVEGLEIGIDVKYSNIPIDDAVSIDIYPNALPSKMLKSLKINDPNFYTYINALLKSKAINYHINYDVLNDSFDGYIKDIDEKQTLSDGTNLVLKLIGTSFSGSGLLIAPDTFILKIKEFKSRVKSLEENIDISLVGFTSSSVFESKTTYATTGKFSSMKWSVENNKDANTELNMRNLAFDFSSNTQSIKADFYAKFSYDTMNIRTSDTQINTSKLNCDVAFRDVSKDSYEKLAELINKIKLDSSLALQLEIVNVGYEMLGRGLVLDIADLSFKDVSTKKTKNLGGMSIRSELILKQDRGLAKKIIDDKMAIIDVADMELLFKMSKPLYSKIAYSSMILSLAQGFAKEEKGVVIFDIKLKDSKLSVNDMEIN